MKNNLLRKLGLKKAIISNLEKDSGGLQKAVNRSSTPLYCHSDLC